MNERTAYIVLDNDFENWTWFKNSKTLQVYIYLLASANLLTEKMFGETIERGSVLINNATIATDCGLTIQNVRTALANLVKSGDITREYKNHYQIIHINHFELRIAD